MRNYRDYDSNGKSKLSTMDIVAPVVSFAALVDAGKLLHLDLVFPEIALKEESLRYWQEFVNEHEDIVFAFGNPSCVGFEPQGEQPLHINMWFKPSASVDVQQLIHDLDKRWGKKGGSGSPISPPPGGGSKRGQTMNSRIRGDFSP